jgi:hypothetical protein
VIKVGGGRGGDHDHLKKERTSATFAHMREIHFRHPCRFLSILIKRVSRGIISMKLKVLLIKTEKSMGNGKMHDLRCNGALILAVVYFSNESHGG